MMWVVVVYLSVFGWDFFLIGGFFCAWDWMQFFVVVVWVCGGSASTHPNFGKLILVVPVIGLWFVMRSYLCTVLINLGQGLYLLWLMLVSWLLVVRTGCSGGYPFTKTQRCTRLFFAWLKLCFSFVFHSCISIGSFFLYNKVVEWGNMSVKTLTDVLIDKEAEYQDNAAVEATNW